MKTDYSYLKIYEKMKREIIIGAFGYGEKLPSKRVAAINENVSVITIQHVYALLSDEGYIEPRERSGYFVVYKPADFLGTDIRRAPQEKKYLTSSEHEPAEFSFNIISKTMRRVILDYSDHIMEKSPNNGCEELRVEIANYLARSRGIICDADQIIVGAGAEYLYCLIGQYFAKHIEIAVEDPCYEKIVKVYEAAEHKIDKLKLGKCGVLSQELERTNAEILHITPFHSYPSNVTADISKKKEYLSWLSEGKYIIEDNYDSELIVSGKMEDSLFALNNGENVIYINTFSKTIAASIRIGYMVMPKELVKKFNDKLGFYSCTVSMYEQLLISELLKSGDFERHINRVRRRLRREQ